MKLEDLGINPKTGFHDRRLTPAESRFVGVFWVDHVGENNCVPANVLAIRYVGGVNDADARRYLTDPDVRIPARTVETWKREVREMYEHILFEHDSIPILSKAGINGGYWLAENEEEAERFYFTFIKRGKTGLRKAVRGKQASLVKVVEQLSFEFDDLDDRTAVAMHARRSPETPTPIKVVDSMFERMLANPEKFEAGIRKLREKYSGILLPREQVNEMKAKADELQRLVSALGG